MNHRGLLSAMARCVTIGWGHYMLLTLLKNSLNKSEFLYRIKLRKKIKKKKKVQQGARIVLVPG
jgi:hypothetical protein